MPTRNRAIARLAAGVALLAAVAAHPAVIYQWVDEEGKTHFADAVPERFKGSAKRVDSDRYEPSAAQQREARERATRDKALAEGASKEPAPPPAAVAPAPASSKRPAVGPAADTDCQTWRQLHLESLECFAPYRTVRGATKAEAFEHCTPVPEPPTRCGRNAF